MSEPCNGGGGGQCRWRSTPVTRWLAGSKAGGGRGRHTLTIGGTPGSSQSETHSCHPLHSSWRGACTPQLAVDVRHTMTIAESPSVRWGVVLTVPARGLECLRCTTQSQLAWAAVPSAHRPQSLAHLSGHGCSHSHLMLQATDKHTGRVRRRRQSSRGNTPAACT